MSEDKPRYRDTYLEACKKCGAIYTVYKYYFEDQSLCYDCREKLNDLPKVQQGK